MIESETNIPDLFPKDYQDRIIPESLQRQAFSSIQEWRVMEHFFGPRLRLSILNKSGSDGLNIENNYENQEIPPDLNYMLGETINESYISEKMNTNQIDEIYIIGTVIGESVSSDYKPLDRHYFMVDDVEVNGRLFSVNELKDFCDKLELNHTPDFGVYGFDPKELVTQYQNYGTNRLVRVLAERLMTKVVDFDRQHGLQSLSPFGELKGCYFPSHGIQARSEPQLFDQQSNRIEFKIKTQDLKKLNNNQSPKT